MDKGTILVVDDNLESLRMLSGILAAEGYQTRPADSGELALASVAASPVELILLDIRMPGLDGFEVCRQLKASKKSRDIPIMLISSANEAGERVQGLRLGAVDFILKPFQEDELLARVRTQLELGRLRAQLERRVAERTAELRVANEHLRLELAERRRVERALRQSEERTRLAMQAGRTYAFEWDSSSGEVHHSENYTEILGFPRNGINEYIQQIHPDDRARIFHAIANLTPGDDVLDAECRLIRADGQIISLHGNARAFFESDGRLKRVIGMVADITERKQAESALRESEERFRNMADTAPVIIWATGPDQLATFLNKQASIFSGRSTEQLLGDDWCQMVHSDDRPQFHSSFASARDTRTGFQVECRLRRADGVYRRALVTGVPRIMADGDYVGHVGTIVDITDLKRNHEQALATQKLESLGVLIAGVAHDFNNLLGTILAEASIVMSDLPPDAAAQQNIGRISDIASRAAEIVGQLITYSGASDEAMLEPVAVSPLVESTLRLLRASISKNVALKTKLAVNLPAALTNATQLQQVLVNLITNGAEALGDREGEVTVTTALVRVNSEDRWVTVPEGDYIRIAVSDTGPGMTEEIRSRIFDPYYTTKFLGRGLGLAAVQGIVRCHGGAINLATTPGGGSTFEILLPCARRPADWSGESLRDTSEEDLNGMWQPPVDSTKPEIAWCREKTVANGA
jgi:PAS domain S-box-containing protein